MVPGEDFLPEIVQLVWHGVNDEANLRQFIASQVFWAEVNITRDPAGEMILRHDTLGMTPATSDETWMTFEGGLATIKRHGRGVKLDLKAGRGVVEDVLVAVAAVGITDDRLWFNANIEAVGEEGFSTAYPDAVVQCPIGWLAPLVAAAPKEGRGTLEMLTSWGITRFSIDWKRPDPRGLMDALASWGYEANFYNVPDLEAFLEAVVLLPASVTSDFNFPQWKYYGSGSGARGERISYKI